MKYATEFQNIFFYYNYYNSLSIETQFNIKIVTKCLSINFFFYDKTFFF